MDTSSISSILAICDKRWSSQAKDVILAAITNVVWIIWKWRNMLRFDNKRPSFQAGVNLVNANISLTGQANKGCLSS